MGLYNHSPKSSIMRTALRGCAIGLATLAALCLNSSGSELIADCTRIRAGVPDANLHEGTPETLVAPGFRLELLAQGTDLLENPSGPIVSFGFLNDKAQTKTEPDENTYLVLDHNPGGPSAGYDYGRHFLFQGHENGGNLAFVTRINLDVVNPDHRITLLTPVGKDGLTHYTRVDGSTYNPFSKTLLFSQENGAAGGVFELSTEWDAATGAAAGIRDLYGSFGQGGYEGIHPDDRGNVYIVEDAGGARVNGAANPNSFVYRFVPTVASDLSQGKLQALQVSIKGTPLTFVPIDSTHPTGDIYSDNQLLLHTLGTSWPVKWVTVHDTAVDGTAPFNANALAKKAGATPFKRPENGQFQPGSKFQSFFFCNTGDTDANPGKDASLVSRGTWGSIMRLDLDKTRDAGTLSTVFLSDADHASFDNVAFASHDVLLLTEDRGDGLHDQLNKLDSIWAIDVSKRPTSAPARLVALGRDRFAAGVEDNEPTGLHYSDGDSTIKGLLGARELRCNEAMLFFTQQHGENNVYRVIGRGDNDDDRGEDRK
ncbi:MAG: DUF839 domain-containing protein [Verrucomicrobia bacterium]|nr:DUF839 domain-containing protein [Verrucomicrobiota bacterium]